MKPVLYVIFALFYIEAVSQHQEVPLATEKKMSWFADAKLGIFIHAGIYAVDGIDESWSFYNKKISHSDYMKQLRGFSLRNYNPAAWADLISESGARYAVITTKHHDGVSMYDTGLSDLSIVKSTPARQDMIAPFFSELRKRNLRCGAYFSLIDWSHENYPAVTKDSSRYRVENDYERWNRFRTFFQGQIKEISVKFNPDLWWFDGDWEHTAEEWEAAKVRKLVLQRNPDAIINSRLQGHGDYETPEQNFPVSKLAHRWWELCMTTNDNWGFHHDDNWKTPYEIITIFTDVVANGGNLLLDMGPMEDGTIPPQQVRVLKELGAWNKKNGEAVFHTVAGIPQGHFYGPTTLSKDSTVLYLFLQGKNAGPVTIKGLKNKIKNITIPGFGGTLEHKIVGNISWSHVPGIVYIEVPQSALDKYVTVLRLQLEGPVSLYKGRGGFN